MNRLNKELLANILQVDPSTFSKECEHILKNNNFIFRHLSDKEREQNFIEITKTIFELNLDKTGQHRKAIWNDGWEENLNLLQNDPQNLESLKPKYYRPNNYVRFDKDYIFSESNQFDYKMIVL